MQSLFLVVQGGFICTAPSHQFLNALCLCESSGEALLVWFVRFMCFLSLTHTHIFLSFFLGSSFH
eukprot:m.359263 g.359263  ORF g.359263 m.359263 type:complete len:65 (-) comp18499_c0_seq1:48-242(-)